MYEYNYTYPNELYHYGVKGMKWGIRRYQDANGTLTAAGRKRYIADKTKGIQKDIDSYAPYRKSGIKSSSGKLVMSPKDVNDIVDGLEQAKNKVAVNSGKRYDRVANRLNSKAELKASIERGKKVAQRIVNNNPYDPEKHRTI